jgi:hypothetical protein
MRSNKNEIRVGDKVSDKYGMRGIVVKIERGVSNEDHGTIFVWQLDETDYGADNCEHYAEFEWETHDYLKIIEYVEERKSDY